MNPPIPPNHPNPPVTPPPPPPNFDPPGAPQQPPRARPAPPDPEAVALATAQRVAIDAAVQAGVTIFNAGGDPLGEREEAILAEHHDLGSSQQQLDAALDGDGVLIGLRNQGIVRR